MRYIGTSQALPTDFIPSTVISTSIRVKRWYKPLFIILFCISKLLLGLFIYYMCRYKQLSGQAQIITPNTLSKPRT